MADPPVAVNGTLIMPGPHDISIAPRVAWIARTLPGWLALALTLVFVLLAIPGNLPSLRRKLVSDAVFAAFRKVMPPMSQTEREAIEAGTVWWDADLFSGKPDWSRMLAFPVAKLTAEDRDGIASYIKALPPRPDAVPKSEKEKKSDEDEDAGPAGEPAGDTGGGKEPEGSDY